jgi:hypothetical protein
MWIQGPKWSWKLSTLLSLLLRSVERDKDTVAE